MQRSRSNVLSEEIFNAREVAVIFLILFLIINFVPDKREVVMFQTWFLLFCTARVVVACFMVLPEKDGEAEGKTGKKLW